MNNAQIIIDNKLFTSESFKKYSIYSPFNNELLASLELASQNQAEQAVESAYNAFQTWKNSNISTRITLFNKACQLLRNKIDFISDILSKEIGKTPEDAKSEVVRAIEYLELTAQAIKFVKGSVFYGDIFEKYPRGKKTGTYSRVPLGVVLAISPFNYPINLSVTKVAPALISGNTVVLKPATIGSLAAFEFYNTFIEAGFPPGVLNFVPGDSKDIGDFLVSHKKISLIAFTGSSNVGNHIRETALGVPLLLELGGKDAAIVTSNANLEITSKEIISGAFSYAGQRCTAQKIVFAYKDIAQKLNDLLIAKAKDLKLNPMINEAASKYNLELVEDAKIKKAQINLEGVKEGNVLSPSVILGVNDSMRIYHEEQFGPVLPIVIVEDEKDAVTQANNSIYGLQASVYTQNLEEAYRIADKLDVGTVQINAKPDRGPDNFPFGGVKDSGQLMQGLIETIELMTRGKLTVLNLHEFDK